MSNITICWRNIQQVWKCQFVLTNWDKTQKIDFQWLLSQAEEYIYEMCFDPEQNRIRKAMKELRKDPSYSPWPQWAYLD